MYEDIEPKTILLVDDDRQVLIFIAEVLRSAGHAVIQATSGEEALRLFNASAEEIDLVFSDIVMPGMSGDQLIALLLKERPGLNYVLMSGNPVASLKTAVPLKEGDNFLSKPFPMQAITDAVERLCG